MRTQSGSAALDIRQFSEHAWTAALWLSTRLFLCLRFYLLSHPLVVFLREQLALAETSFFYNLMFALRWLADPAMPSYQPNICGCRFLPLKSFLYLCKPLHALSDGFSSQEVRVLKDGYNFIWQWTPAIVCTGYIEADARRSRDAKLQTDDKPS
jgi:hypothetical protein